jgi:hypothetical protein
MSNYEDFQDFEDDDQPENESKQNPARAHMRKLEKENKELRKEREELLALKREQAFIKAGIDTSTPLGKIFMKGYDGDVSPDAIQQAAIEAQLLTPPSNEVSDADAWSRVDKVAQGAGTANPPIDWNRRIQEAESQAEVERILAEAQQALQN